MSLLTGTTNLLDRLRCGDEQARSELISHACERLRRLASHMLDRYPGVRRWEQTDDVLQYALVRLSRALETVRPETPLHFHRLGALQIRRTLLDLLDRYQGPQGHGANHHTDGEGRAADDPGGVYSRHAVRGEPSSAAEWAEFLEAVEMLPEEEREVVDLVWVQGLTQEEAVVLLDISLRTVRRRLRAARLSLAGIAS
jgi:RNA polymerase sigma-70 factor (ECF subfamily)